MKMLQAKARRYQLKEEEEQERQQIKLQIEQQQEKANKNKKQKLNQQLKRKQLQNQIIQQRQNVAATKMIQTQIQKEQDIEFKNYKQQQRNDSYKIQRQIQQTMSMQQQKDETGLVLSRFNRIQLENQQRIEQKIENKQKRVEQNLYLQKQQAFVNQRIQQQDRDMKTKICQRYVQTNMRQQEYLYNKKIEEHNQQVQMNMTQIQQTQLEKTRGIMGSQHRITRVQNKQKQIEEQQYNRNVQLLNQEQQKYQNYLKQRQLAQLQREKQLNQMNNKHINFQNNWVNNELVSLQNMTLKFTERPSDQNLVNSTTNQYKYNQQKIQQILTNSLPELVFQGKTEFEIILNLRENQQLIQQIGILDIIQLNQLLAPKDYVINYNEIDMIQLRQTFQQLASDNIYQQWIFSDIVTRYNLTSFDLQYFDLQTIMTLGLDIQLFIQLMTTYGLSVYTYFIGIQLDEIITSKVVKIQSENIYNKSQFVLYNIEQSSIKTLTYYNQQLIYQGDVQYIYSQSANYQFTDLYQELHNIIIAKKQMNEEFEGQQKTFQLIDILRQQFICQSQLNLYVILDMQSVIIEYLKLLNIDMKQQQAKIQIQPTDEITIQQISCIKNQDIEIVCYKLVEIKQISQSQEQSAQYDYSTSANIFDLSNNTNNLFDFDNSFQPSNSISQAQTLQQLNIFENPDLQVGSQINQWQSLPVNQISNKSWSSQSASIPLSLHSLTNQLTSEKEQYYQGYVRYHFPSYRILLIQSEYINKYYKTSEYSQVVVYIYEKINIPYICGYKCMFQIDVEKSKQYNKIAFAKNLTILQDYKQVYQLYNQNLSHQPQALIYYLDNQSQQPQSPLSSTQSNQQSHTVSVQSPASTLSQSQYPSHLSSSQQQSSQQHSSQQQQQSSSQSQQTYGFAKLPTGIPIHFQTNQKNLIANISLLNLSVPSTDTHPSTAKLIKIQNQFDFNQNFYSGKIIYFVEKERQHQLLDQTFKTPQIQQNQEIDILQGFILCQSDQKTTLLPLKIIQKFEVNQQIYFNLTPTSPFKCIDQVCIDHKQDIEKINQIINKTVKFSLQKANKFKDKESCWASNMIALQDTYECQFIQNNQICGFKPLKYDFYEKYGSFLENGNFQLIFAPKKFTTKQKQIFKSDNIYQVSVAFKVSGKGYGKFLAEAVTITCQQKSGFVSGVYKNGYLETDFYPENYNNDKNGQNDKQNNDKQKQIQQNKFKFYIINQKQVFCDNQKIFTKKYCLFFLDGDFVWSVMDVDSIDDFDGQNQINNDNYQIKSDKSQKQYSNENYDDNNDIIENGNKFDDKDECNNENVECLPYCW